MKTPKQNRKGSLRVPFYRDNTNKPVNSQNPNASMEVIQAWLVSKLSNLLEIDADDIDIRQPFGYYGLGSAQAVSLAGELEDWLGRKLPATLAWDYPNIEALARYLAEEAIPEHADRTLPEDGEEEDYEVR